MAPRAYDNAGRLQQQAELKSRIAAAAAQLHAEKGALATSWADIAQAAGVSLPTVYKHFPDFDALIPACTGHAAASAPPLPAERILACDGLDAAAAELVQAVDRIHAYYEPWLAWGEHRSLPVLADQVARERAQLTAFCRAVLQRHLGDAAGLAEMAAQWEALLHFDFWHGLVRQHRLSRAAVRRLTTHLLLAVTGPQPAADPPARPTRRKTP
jgi:AcrR family transcriptional regulator